jgi:alpha 1,2-mannosyltransferase
LNIKLIVAAYDPFLVMQDNKKVYGFTLSLYEYIETIPTLWDAVKGELLIFCP